MLLHSKFSAEDLRHHISWTGLTGSERRNSMRRLLLAVACIAMCAPAWSGTTSARQTASTHSSTASKSTSTPHKSTKKRRRSTKFVPKQKAPTADRITEIQSALARGGYYQGNPNGKWDGNSIAAMQKFQSANSLDPTGKLDAPSLQRLGLGSDVAGVSAPKPLVQGGGQPSTPATTPSPSSPGSSNSPGAATTSASNNASAAPLAAKAAQP